MIKMAILKTRYKFIHFRFDKSTANWLIINNRHNDELGRLEHQRVQGLVPVAVDDHGKQSGFGFPGHVLLFGLGL